MTDPNHQAIARVFDSIAPCWPNDMAGFRAHYRLPCMVFAPGQVLSVPDETTFAAIFGSVLARLVAQGYQRSAYEALQVKTLTPTLALATMSWTRYAEADRVLETLGATYTLVREEGDWRVATVAMHGVDALSGLG